MARSTSIAYYPKLDGLAEELDELGSDIQAMKNGVCVVSVQTSAGVDVLANAQVTTEVQKQEERYRILFFNWTNEVCQFYANVAAWMGLIDSCIFFITGQFWEGLDPVIYRYSLNVGPILHAITCLSLMAGIRFKKHRLYVVYVALNILLLVGFFFFSMLLFIVAEKHYWHPVYLFFAVVHLLLFFPHLLSILVVRTAGELMQLKPLVNIGMISGRI